jgi:hypothetical protein
VTRLLAALLLIGGPLAGLAGCASTLPERPGPTTPGPSADEQEVAHTYDDLLRANVDLHDAQAQAAAPDCARIAPLRDNICALAARICQIADRQPPGSPTAGHCTDGKARCQAAVEAARSRGCPTQK